MAITDYAVKGLLGAALKDSPANAGLSALATRVASQLPAGSGEKLDFLGMVPAMREWVGARSAKAILEHKYTVTLKKFESTIDIPMDWIKNDKTALVDQRIRELVRRYNPEWYAAQVATLINNSASALCFDGKAFFADDHSWGDSGTIDNNIDATAATGTAPTALEAANAIIAAVVQMQGFKDDKGQPMNESINRVTVVIPPSSNAASILLGVKQNMLSTGSGVVDNPLKGLGLSVDVIVSARITLADTKMVVLNSSDGALPFVMLENTGEFMQSAKAAGSDYEHDQDAWQFGLKAVGVGGYGRPTDACLVTFT